MRTYFRDHSVLITGASAGIGAALAIAFGAQGAKVSLCARRKERLHEIAEQVENAGGTALALSCDVTRQEVIREATEKTVAAFGGLDVAIANAGFGVSGLLEDLSVEDYRRQFETNFFGVLNTIYATLPYLKQSQGRLVVISSVLGRVASPSSSAYCSSKFALCGLSDALYYELREQGVSVTCIEPGLIATEFRQVDNKGQYHPEAEDPAPRWLRVSPERAARSMLRAIYHRRPEAVITNHGKLIVWLARHFPRALRMAAGYAVRGRLKKLEQHRRGPINSRD